LIYFIIPAHNEEKNLLLLLKNTKEAMMAIGRPYKIYIVNDGSTDKTSTLCHDSSGNLPIEEIRFERNEGVDKAFRAGFEEVFKFVKEGDIIVTKEADNTSDLDILNKMIQLVDAGNDIVLASCFAKEGRVENSSIDRRILSFGANTLLKMFFPIKGVNTYSSFYRAFNANTLKMAFVAYDSNLLEEKGFVCMVELLAKLSRLPLKIIEVPMVLRCDKREGVSKMRRRKTISGYLKFILKQLVRPRSENQIIYKRFCKLAGLNDN
jgi:dolichol-phosphate mannosyltransferase